MYRAWFNLSDDPFRKDLPTDQLFQSELFSEASQRLDYLKNNRGLMLLTGDPGTGKSTIIRNFVHSLNKNSFSVFYAQLSTVSVIDFYRQILFMLSGEKLHRKCDLFRKIQQCIQTRITSNRQIPIFIFDEAHLLKNDNFTELQLLMNFEFDSVLPLLVILVGQPHLRDRLTRDNLRSFAQRITIRYHLLPLSKPQTLDFIQHSICRIGGDISIFSESALDAIYNIATGNIRVTANIASKALISATLCKRKAVSEEDVFNAEKEIH